MIKNKEDTSYKIFDDWESMYSKENPWGLDGSLSDFLRIKIINDCFKNRKFKNGLDIACGEGFLLNKLDFIKNKKGIDISKKAIDRAKKKYPNINFYAGNPFLDFRINEKFEFISCFEGLYYLPSLKERKKAIKNLLNYGYKDTIYAFSVVTIGSDEWGDYYTKNSFLELLSEDYEVLKVVTLRAAYKPPMYLRILQKCLSLFNKRLTANLFFKYVLNSTEDQIYTELFICKRT